MPVIPLLPFASIDDMLAFYSALGFERTFRGPARRVRQGPGVGHPAYDAPEPAGKLGRTLENAVVLADSHGDPAQAAKILDGALRRSPDASTV